MVWQVESRSIKTQDFTINLSLFNQLVVSSNVEFNNYLQSYPKRPNNFLDYTFWLIFFFKPPVSPASPCCFSFITISKRIIRKYFNITFYYYNFFGQNMVLFSLYYNVSNSRNFFYSQGSSLLHLNVTFIWTKIWSARSSWSMTFKLTPLVTTSSHRDIVGISFSFFLTYW